MEGREESRPHAMIDTCRLPAVSCRRIFKRRGLAGVREEERKMAEQLWWQKEAELTFCRKIVLCTGVVEEAVHQRRQLGLQILNPESQGLAPASNTDQLPLQGLKDICSVPETNPPTAPTSQG